MWEKRNPGRDDHRAARRAAGRQVKPRWGWPVSNLSFLERFTSQTPKDSRPFVQKTQGRLFKIKVCFARLVAAGSLLPAPQKVIAYRMHRGRECLQAQAQAVCRMRLMPLPLGVACVSHTLLPNYSCHYTRCDLYYTSSVCVCVCSVGR